MEFPSLGQNCTEITCKKLDFLPIKCESCADIFCTDHYHYNNHSCPNAYKKNIQVPVCPLCDQPVPTARNQTPDIAVGAHIDNDCQADPAKNRRKVFTNKCSAKGCKNKEVIPIVCGDCSMNFCLKHRHITDHNCQGKVAALRERAAAAAANRTDNVSPFANVQGNMSEDEALARALALSMQDTARNKKNLTQEEIDLALARQLQASETVTVGSGSRSSRDRCRLS